MSVIIVRISCISIAQRNLNISGAADWRITFFEWNLVKAL